MNKKLIDWWAGSAGEPASAYYAAVLARADTLGYGKPTAKYAAQNALANDIDFSLFDLVYIPAVNDASVESFGNLNWKTPASFLAVKSGAGASYGTTGWNCGASTGYWDTQFNCSTQGTTWVDASAVSVSIWIATYGSAGDYVATNGATGARNLLYRSSATVTGATLHTNPEGTITYTTGAEASYDFITYSVYGGNKYLFKNGSQIGTAAASLSTSPSFTLRVMMSLHTGHPNNTVMGAVLVGGGITLAQHQTLNTAFATYKTAIGL